MCRFKLYYHKIMPIFQLLFSMVWLSNLSDTDAFFSVYTLIAFFSFYLQLHYFSKNSLSVKNKSGCVLLSTLFSFSVFLANYPLFTTLGDPALIGRSTSILMNLIDGCFTFFGGICVFCPVVLFFFSYFPVIAAGEGKTIHKLLPWITVFTSFLIINLIHLFFVEFPGNVTEDTFTQIGEMISGRYSNFNTFWHTILFQSVLTGVYRIFQDQNISIAVFCIFQILIFAFAFTYCLETMYQYGVPKKWLVATYCVYAFLPYNIALSITIWKDVLFAAGCLVMITAWFRILYGIGIKKIYNYIIFVAGSILFLLSRTNGWIIYLVSFLFVLFFARSNRRFAVLMGSLAVFGWFLLNPALSILNVSGGDLVESLSIPVQQVSRVVVEECELTEGERELLSQVIDLDEVPYLYTEWLSDPMKVELRSKNYEYFIQHFDEYRSLWVQLGMRYPIQYLKAWVDQTKGYWNAGYDYALYSETITDNPYGIMKSANGNVIASLSRLYFGLSRHVIFFEPFHSIGLHVWVFFLCFLLNVVKKRKQCLIFIPLILLIVGLWFGTPVYCCFRYVYPLFVSLPLLVFTSLFLPVIE